MVLRRSLRGDCGPQLNEKEVTQALKRIEEQIETSKASDEALISRLSEWKATRSLLQELPEKVQHPIMVPLGPLAFFEGALVSTNEVLTQLSSEYFALRTTKQAVSMADRRMLCLEQDRADVAREIEELLQRRAVARAALGGSSKSSMNVSDPAEVPGASINIDDEGYFDIREPYQEDLELPEVPTALAPSSGAVCHHSALAARSDIAGNSKESPELLRLRELERLEELEALDDLLKEAESMDDVQGRGVDEGPVLDRLGMDVKDPSDLFRLMSQGGNERSLSADEDRAFSGRVIERSTPPPPCASTGAEQPAVASKFKRDRLQSRA